MDYQVLPIKQYLKKGDEQIIFGYRIEATLSSSLQAISNTKETLGRFMLATNQLNEELLPSSEILT